MMPQMEPNQPIYEQSNTTYSPYEGNRRSFQQQYETPYQQTSRGETLDYNVVEAVSRRMAQLMSQQSADKIHTQRPSYGKNLTLGIVFVIMVTILAGICLGVVGGVVGFIAFLTSCSAMFFILD